ncbi:hypothetical protein RASY3_02435 [Ruminococcus albus SY3]|uniref:LicD/FKTN/FKRP nucleotidyltransferase domain-containing protein n=1 Tax=Ruminococcus albus SY3 TaxID=1341156 RepID=A0A011WVJ7_RUMAL|nr:LicD family protein [Ruminococcus albus]EXM40995.1 hypothetical protein RASY3_02435 [Ruminococcus albus SY3]
MDKWKEYYSDTQIKKLQAIALENLRIFIEACETLRLTYFVYGGTLLGVEKYNKMIPWDDDIDVAMPRDSYMKFVKYAPKILPKEYYIQSPYNNKNCPYPYVKLRKRGTKYVEYINRNLNIETGIYIDIYPIDRIPDNEHLRRKQFKKVRKWILIYVYRQSRLFDKDEHSLIGHLKNLIKWGICNTCKVFSQKYCIKKIDQYMTMYNDTKTQRYAALNSPNYNNIYLKLYPLKKAMFNGIEVNIPGDHKTHLKMRYGDYSKLPPEEERYGHVPYILDLGDSKKE